jgi:hypothetical protein
MLGEFQRTELPNLSTQRLISSSSEQRFWKKFDLVFSDYVEDLSPLPIFNIPKNLMVYSSQNEIRIFDLRRRINKGTIRKNVYGIQSLALRPDAEILGWGSNKGKFI